MSEEIQRRVIHIADAIVAGQGNGPLAPEPLELGLLLGSNNAAAMDWIGAQLLAYDAGKISLVRQAFGQFHWPIAGFPSSSVQLVGDLGTGPPRPALDAIRVPVTHPVGWRDAAVDHSSARDRQAEVTTSSVEPQDA